MTPMGRWLSAGWDMPIEILMPALSPTMTEGNLAKWLKQRGRRGPFGRRASPKSRPTRRRWKSKRSTTAGSARSSFQRATQGVRVNQPIALLLGEGEDSSALGECRLSTGAERSSQLTAVPPPRRQRPRQQARPPRQLPPRQQAPRASGNGHDRRIFASPLARRMAQQAGLDLAADHRLRPARADRQIRHRSGDSGSARSLPPLQARRQPGAAAAPITGRTERLPRRRRPFCRRSGCWRSPATRLTPSSPLNAMRRVIARRLTEAKQTVPHFYLTIDCEIDELLRIRARAERADRRA